MLRLAKRLHGSHGHLHGAALLSKRARDVTLLGLGANLVLLLAKGSAGVYFRSASLVADAAHSLSDLVTDGITLAAIKVSKLPPNHEYPVETAATLSIGAILIGGSLGIGYHSYELLWQVEQTLEHAMHPAALFFAGSSILVKEWLYRITKNIGEETRSDVLVANAWHHRSDAFSSIVAFGGILGTIIGFPVLDPIGGIIVAGMILQSGGSITANAFKELVDARVDDPVIQGVQKILDELMAESKLSIKDVLQIRARKMGPYTLVDMYVSVPPRLSISTGHQIAEHIRHEILHELPVVTEVMVHIVPEDIEDHLAPPIPMRPHGEVEAEVTKVLLNVPGIRTVSHVLIHHSNGKCIVQAEVSVDMEQSLQSAGDIVLQAEHEASKITGVDSVDLHLELKTHHARA